MTDFLCIVKKPGLLVPFRQSYDDTMSFTAMYNRYLPVVKKHIRFLSNRGEIYPDDIAQDIFLKLWERREMLLQIESFEDYLFIMARNRLLTEKERARTRQKAVIHLESAASGAAECTKEDIHCRYIWRKYNEGLRSLPPRMREAYELKEQAGLRNEEIAGWMDISESCAKQHTGIAAKKIKAYMEAQGCY